MPRYYDGLIAFLFRQLFYTIPEVPPTDLHGKTVLLTGASSGIGYSLALQLARQGAEVITAVRSVPKGEAARERILEQVPEAQIKVRECDLASFDAVMSFVNGISRDSMTFNLAILNAGVWCSDWITSSDGMDISLQVNVLSNALLAVSLLPHLRYDGGRPQIVFVTSEGHAMVPSEFSRQECILDYLNQGGSKFDHYNHYYSSKLFGLLWVLALSRRVDHDKLGVILVSPGLCKSDLFRDVNSASNEFLAQCFARSCDEGARMVLLASVTAPKSLQNSYYSQGSLVPVSSFCSGTEGFLCQERLWEEISNILECVSPGFEKHLQGVS